MSTVLVAESCKLLAPVLCGILRKAGLEAVVAESATQVVSILGDRRPELILLDLDASACGGLNTVRYIRRLKSVKGVKIVGITFNRDRQSLIAALQAGLNGIVLREQHGPEMLLDRIKKLLEPASIREKSPATAKSLSQQGSDRAGAITGEAQSIAGAEMGETQKKPRPPPLTMREVTESLPRLTSAKALRPIVQQIIAMAGNPNTELADIATVLRNDVGLSAKVIAAANSAFYRRKSGSARTLAEAVNVIGMQGTRELAMTLGLVASFCANEVTPQLALPGLWAHSVSVAHICEALAQQTNACDPDQAFLLGLLHDLGRRLMAEHFPDHYLHVVSTSPVTAPPLCELERAIVGVDHAVLGSMALERWGCPSFITRAIRLHHAASLQSDEGEDPLGGLGRVLVVADAMATAFGYEADVLEELQSVPRVWLGKALKNPLEFREGVFASLQEAQGLIMSRAEVQFTIPSPWEGVFDQIVVLGAVPQPLEPLQMLLGHAYRGSQVVPPAQARPDQARTLLLADLRACKTAEEAWVALTWLHRARVPESWPLFLVTSLPADKIRVGPLSSLSAVRAAPPLRSTTLRSLVEPLAKNLDRVAPLE